MRSGAVQADRRTHVRSVPSGRVEIRVCLAFFLEVNERVRLPEVGPHRIPEIAGEPALGPNMTQKFVAHLTARGPHGAWTFLVIPFSVEAVFGSRARVPVVGTINGFAFRNSLMPQGDGTHAMMVGKELRLGAGAGPGDQVSVVLDIDRSERVVELPPELREALRVTSGLREAFDALSPSHRKEFADWVDGAKKDETRQARCQKSIAMIFARRHVK